MLKTRIWAIILLILGFWLGYFIYSSEVAENSNFPFRYGLDLDGGTHLTYRADTTQVSPSEVNSAMDSLRRTIEKRINIFGVSEPIVQVEKGSVFSNNVDENRLSVELPGVTDIDKAIDAIGKTPVLEFRLAKSPQGYIPTEDDSKLSPEEINKKVYDMYEHTGLGGSQLEKSQISFNGMEPNPLVLVTFNSEGSKLFENITKNNLGKQLGIFLDGQLLSSPVIQQEIVGGTAQISGNFTPDEAKILAQDLNLGALPLPIELIETQTVGASLGRETLDKSINAFYIAFIVISIFLIVWYRIPGVIATLALLAYTLITFAIFKLVPVTLTSSGLAGFILSVGMAVDANVLIFERMKEEFKVKNKSFHDAIHDGFKRAWPPIRDGNISSLFSAVVMYWLSGTALVQGFALVFGLGVLTSMISAVIISKTLLFAISPSNPSKLIKTLFNNGFNFKDK